VLVKRSTIEQIGAFVALVALTAGLRFELRDIPNFAPVAAVSLFAGFFFTSRLVAVLVPLSVMWITDYWIGGYQPLLMLTVYALLLLPVLLRGWLRHSFRGSESMFAWVGSILGVLACTVTMSLLFFVATNLMTWLVTPWYPRSVAGLWRCYVNAIPFFRYTLAGDLSFAVLLFGGYAICQRMATTQSREINLETPPAR
jgi:hypothetical protein